MKLSAAYLKRREEWTQEAVSKVAANCLREGVAPEVVARATELSIAEVEHLRASLSEQD